VHDVQQQQQQHRGGELAAVRLTDQLSELVHTLARQVNIEHIVHQQQQQAQTWWAFCRTCCSALEPACPHKHVLFVYMQQQQHEQLQQQMQCEDQQRPKLHPGTAHCCSACQNAQCS
jgi:tRNA(Ile)-lysidine synthase TilS/MesJ